MSIPQASVSKPAARQEIQKVELTRCHVNPPGERQRAGSAASYPECGTHTLLCQSPGRTSASRQRGKGSRRWNSQAVMSIPQANVSKPAARQVIQKVELTSCQFNPPGERQQAGSAARDPEGGTHKLSIQSPGRTSASQQRGKGSRRGTHALSFQSSRRTSASRQRGKGSRRGTHALSCQSPGRTLASWQRGKGSRRRNSLAVMSIPQARVSKRAARQMIQKVELTSCHVNPPGERQQAGSTARDPEGGTH